MDSSNFYSTDIATLPPAPDDPAPTESVIAPAPPLLAETPVAIVTAPVSPFVEPPVVKLIAPLSTLL